LQRGGEFNVKRQRDLSANMSCGSKAANLYWMLDTLEIKTA
jgi:hypothetical protein